MDILCERKQKISGEGTHIATSNILSSLSFLWLMDGIYSNDDSNGNDHDDDENGDWRVRKVYLNTQQHRKLSITYPHLLLISVFSVSTLHIVSVNIFWYLCLAGKEYKEKKGNRVCVLIFVTYIHKFVIVVRVSVFVFTCPLLCCHKSRSVFLLDEKSIVSK